MNPPLTTWFLAFALTVMIEVPIVAVLLGKRVGWPRAVLAGLGAQLVTHPALWYVVPRFEPYAAWLTVAEVGVFAVEAAVLVMLMRTVEPRWGVALALGLGTSLAANAVSTAVGLALHAVGWL